MKRLIIAMLLMACLGVFSSGHAFSGKGETVSFKAGLIKLKPLQLKFLCKYKVYYQIKMEYMDRDYDIYLTFLDKDGFILLESLVGSYHQGDYETIKGDFMLGCYEWDNASRIDVFYR